MKIKKTLTLGIFGKYITATAGEKVEITDEEYFLILKVMPDFLQSSIAIERIRLWQKELNSSNNGKSSSAEEKLKRIGSTLALKKRRKTLAIEKREDFIDFRQNALSKIKEAGIAKCRNNVTMKTKLKELFNPALIDRVFKKYLQDYPQGYIPKNVMLANMITAEFFHYTILTVERYIEKPHKS